jgi:divalent metal cation (Fe/Co/Zn/Cd) transporter
MTEEPNPYQTPEEYSPDAEQHSSGEEISTLAWFGAIVLAIPAFIFGFFFTCLGSGMIADSIGGLVDNLVVVLLAGLIGGIIAVTIVFRLILKRR